MSVTILGGGISGLVYAYRYSQKNPHSKIILLEASANFGGWIQTISQEEFKFEAGPQKIRSKGPSLPCTLELIRDLRLEKEVVADKSGFPALAVVNGSLKKLTPTSLAFYLGSEIMKERFFPPVEHEVQGDNGSDESIQNFVLRRFGPKTALIASALVHGIHGGETSELSMRACFPIVFDLLTRYKSLITGVLSQQVESNLDPKLLSLVSGSRSFTFINGMSTLVSTLVKNLESNPNVELHKSTPCIDLSFSNETFTLETPKSTIQTERVISTLPAHALGFLLSKPLEPPSPLVINLNSVKWLDISVVNFGFKESLSIKAIGALLSSSENSNLLGVMFDSTNMKDEFFSPKRTKATFLYVKSLNSSKNKLVNESTAFISKHFNISKTPDAIHISHHKNALPQYSISHRSLVSEIEKEIRIVYSDKLRLLGNWVQGIGILDCIKNATERANSNWK